MTEAPEQPYQPAQLLTIREVAGALKISADTVRRMIKRGELAYVDVGTNLLPAYRVEVGEVEAYLDRRRAPHRA